MVPLPCIPQTTYIKEGAIADYVDPKTLPMVPAIVVHCSNEVEARGLSEVGIYRVPGSKKDVKELKVSKRYKFLFVVLIDILLRINSCLAKEFPHSRNTIFTPFVVH